MDPVQPTFHAPDMVLNINQTQHIPSAATVSHNAAQLLKLTILYRTIPGIGYFHVDPKFHPTDVG